MFVILHCEVVRHWHMLPRHFVGAPSLETLKTRLDGTLSIVVYDRGIGTR